MNKHILARERTVH